jgi:hypothetical protein
MPFAMVGPAEPLIHGQRRRVHAKIGGKKYVAVGQLLLIVDGDGDRHVLQALLDSPGRYDDLGERAVVAGRNLSECRRQNANARSARPAQPRLSG